MGALFFVWLFGIRILDVTYVDWLLHSNDIEGSIDLTQHFLGWEFFRRTHWQFPVGLTEGIYWEPVSVVYTDSIPLFAMVCKLLSFLLPEHFQYFGWFGFLCYALLGGFAALLVHRLTRRGPASMVAAVLFVANPVLLNRMFLHTALSAHFLIVAAFCLWAFQRDLSVSKKAGLWSLLIVCGTLINAYFTPMLFGILAVSLLQEVLEKQKPAALLWTFGSPLVLTSVAAFVTGFFYGDVPKTAGGLRVLSFNINGFFNPFTYLTAFGRHTQGYRDMMYSAFLPGQALSTAYQNEGFSYLGLGVLVLGLLTLVLLVLQRRRLHEILHRPFVISAGVLVVVFTFLALSPTATWGSHILYELKLPAPVENLWSAFRSTARFIWVVYYFVLASVPVLWTKLTEMKPKNRGRISGIAATAVLPLLVVVQLADLSPGYREKREAFHSLTPYESPLQAKAWEELGESVDAIIFYPDTEYGLYLDGKTSTDFEIYALNYDLRLNNTYMSRNLCAQADQKTMAHFKKRQEGESFRNILYVFFDDTDVTKLPSSYHLKYRVLDGYTVGTEQE